MVNFQEYLNKIDNLSNKDRLVEVLEWVKMNYPTLETRIAWNQPVFTDHGTFIIAFSHSKHHISLAPEHVTINHFVDLINDSVYDYSKELIKIKWHDEVDYSLIKKIIDYNIIEKKNCKTFWRK